MKYIITDYLYNWDETNCIKLYCTENGIEVYLLYPVHNNQEPIKLAVSREALYRRFEIQGQEIEYDIFEIDFHIDCEIQQEQIIVRNENEVRNYISDFAHSVHSLLASFGSNCFMQNMEDRNRIVNIMRLDSNTEFTMPREDEFKTFSLDLLFDGHSLIRDARGNDILRFNSYNNAKQVFQILTRMINRIIQSIRVQ